MSRIDEILARVDAVNERLRELADGGPRPLSFPCAHGGTILVTLCPSELGKWRATRLDEDGEPTGHSARDDFPSALRAAHERGAEVLPPVHTEP